MTQVFISYRRDDSPGLVDRVREHLTARLGKRTTFRDLENIPKGADFQQVISAAIWQCDVVLVVIGPRWMSSVSPNGTARLENSDDPVRAEIELAFAIGKRILPVLVSSAKMPSVDALPTCLQPLVRLNALSVRHDPDFNADIQYLADAIKATDQLSANNRSPTWIVNSRAVDESDDWSEAKILVVGVQYSSKFFRDHFDVIQSRSSSGLPTLALVLEPDGYAAEYLRTTQTGLANVAEGIREIQQLLKEADNGRGYARLKKHDRVMRYSFIRTEDRIWVKFFTNTSYRTLVPAVCVDRGQEPFDFFEEDTRQLEEAARD